MTSSDPHLFPEWHPQTCVWAGWPNLPEEWGAAFEPARAEIAAFVSTLAEIVPVRLVVASAEAEASARAVIGSAAEIVGLPMGDIWLRDTGPLFALKDGNPAALTFGFNGWGGKYVMPGDTETGQAIAAQAGISGKAHDFILEGGAIDLDGAGRLITTRQCLLNPNRNPGWDEAIAEAALKDALGISEIIWLGDGLRGDHTDGHVDNLARFIAPGHVVCPQASGEDDPNRAVYDAAADTLKAAGLNVSRIPSPGLILLDGEAAPASHMNFLMTNDALIMPAFESHYSARAMAALAEAMPGRDVIALPARAILSGGGTYHCMTCNQPDFTVAP